jgi:hypothetical protein
MHTLNSPNLTPVQDGPDREDHKSVKKKKKQEKKRRGVECWPNGLNHLPFCMCFVFFEFDSFCRLKVLFPNISFPGLKSSSPKMSSNFSCLQVQVSGVVKKFISVRVLLFPLCSPYIKYIIKNLCVIVSLFMFLLLNKKVTILYKKKKKCVWLVCVCVVGTFDNCMHVTVPRVFKHRGFLACSVALLFYSVRVLYFLLPVSLFDHVGVSCLHFT